VLIWLKINSFSKNPVPHTESLCRHRGVAKETPVNSVVAGWSRYIRGVTYSTSDTLFEVIWTINIRDLKFCSLPCVSTLNIHRTCAARVYLIGAPRPKTHPKPVGVRTERGRCCFGGDSDLVTMDRRPGIIYSQSGHGGDYERELEASFYHCWCPERLVYYETI
jgi:hypothetical protein